jgi:uncharacterized membrane protein
LKSNENGETRKESDIIETIAVRLCGFNTVLNFLESIINWTFHGWFWDNRNNEINLRRRLCLPHFKRKAVPRAIRVHFILDATLHVLLPNFVFKVEDNNYLIMTLNFQAQLHLKEEIKQLLAEPTPIEEIQNKESQNANNIKTISNSKLTTLMTSRTAKMWIQ